MEPAKKRRISRLGIVVVAAILVEIISIAQRRWVSGPGWSWERWAPKWGT